MKKVIIISGAPGIGKTVVSLLLHEQLGFPIIDFGRMVIAYKDVRPNEVDKNHQQMSFDILMKAIQCHIKYDYCPIIVNDLHDDQVQQVHDYLDKNDYIIISLYIKDQAELQERVLTESRDGSYSDVKDSWERNTAMLDRPLLPNEHRLDNTERNPEKMSQAIQQILK